MTQGPMTPLPMPTLSKSPMPSSPMTPMSGATATTTKSSMAIICNCSRPAKRLTVKKDGPNRGRHFFRCEMQLCEFFLWDPVETDQLKQAMGQDPEVSPEVDKMKAEMAEATRLVERREAAVKEKEEAIMQEMHRREASLLEAQASISQHAQQLVETAMNHANSKHEELMNAQKQQHQLQLEGLQGQLMFMTAVAGEDRVSQVMSDPAMQAESMRQAMQLRQAMMQQQQHQGPAEDVEDDW